MDFATLTETHCTAHHGFHCACLGHFELATHFDHGYSFAYGSEEISRVVGEVILTVIWCGTAITGGGEIVTAERAVCYYKYRHHDGDETRAKLSTLSASGCAMASC